MAVVAVPGPDFRPSGAVWVSEHLAAEGHSENQEPSASQMPDILTCSPDEPYRLKSENHPVPRRLASLQNQCLAQLTDVT